jgi:hypothetical protein
MKKLNLPDPKQLIERIRLGWDRLTNRSYLRTTDPFVIQRNLHKQKTPLFRNTLIECSLEEDEENPYYSGVLNTLSNHCCGSLPIPVALVEEDEVCDAIEDRFIEWGIENQIGSAIRQLRRTAARSGIGVAIPHKIKSDHDISLAFQIVGAEYLKSPSFRPEVINGVEFDAQHNIKAVWIQEEGKPEPTQYFNMPTSHPNKCIVWSRRRVHQFWPECAPAFQTYPSIRRYIVNIQRAAENQTSIPMAIELDPAYYPVAMGTPEGKFEYEPGWVPTLPPGSKLTGINFGQMAEDRTKFVDLLVGSAARCIDMPTILALSDSSDSNMATAHIDLQPWSYAVKIDRFDYEIAVRKVFWMWYKLANLYPGYLPRAASKYKKPPVLFHYNVLFEHPDPGKRASARATDLESGASTLTRIYNEQGLTARREIQKECKLLKITPERYFELLLSVRNKNASDTVGTKSESNKKQQRSEQDQIRRLQRRAS